MANLKVEFLSRDGLKLKGLFLPSPRSSTAILVCHGKYASKDHPMIIGLSLALNKAGFNALAFDFRDHGESEKAKSNFGFFEKSDILGAINYLKSIGLEKIGAYGVSMGGAAVIFAAAESEAIEALVCESVYASWEKNAQIGEIGPAHPQHEEAVRQVKKHLGIEEEIAPLNYIEGLKRPILLIHGAKDKVVPLSDARLLFEKAQEPKELWVIPEADHFNAYQLRKEEYENRVINFFKKASQ